MMSNIRFYEGKIKVLKLIGSMPNSSYIFLEDGEHKGQTFKKDDIHICVTRRCFLRRKTS